MTLRLDRMAIEEVGTNPARLAAAIHAQLGAATSAVPVHEIARALDIVEIRVELLSNLEGALIAPPERGEGKILVNAASPRRQRFTIAHELGHYLSPHHVPTRSTGFWCTKADLRTHSTRQDVHTRQEVEANTFAIELLAPRHRTRPFCRSTPDLAHVLALSDELELSREAAVRRYVEHHPEMLAAVFSLNGHLRYSAPAPGFPDLALQTNGPVPDLPSSSAENPISRIEDAESDDWLRSPRDSALTAQTLHLRDGYAYTLLHLAEDPADQDDGIEDTVQRFGRFRRD